MARLKAPPSRLTALRPLLVAPKEEAGRTTYRATAIHYRQWYGTSRWQKLRAKIKHRDLYLCQMPGCGKACAEKYQAEVDHKRPHRGDPELFWNEDNLWTLCVHCHSSVKQREERQGQHDTD